MRKLLRNASKQEAERLAVDDAPGWQLETSAVKALVENAVALAIEPEDLEPVLSLVDENEKRAAIRSFAEMFPRSQGEAIEGTAHVLRLAACENADS